MKVLFKHTLSIFQVLLIAAMLSTSFMVTQGFFNDLVTSKQYGLEIISLLAGVLFVAVLLFQREVIVTKTDLLVILFAAWYVISELITSGNFTSISLILFELFLWGLIYMIVRQFSGNSVFVWGVAIVWMAVVFLQSGLGLMQLYGLERSYHGLFRITGTFHNPGPFSGFVVSGLPLALGVVCFTEVRSGVKDGNRGVFLKWLDVNISFISIFRYFIITLAWITLVSILLVLPPAQSRAAWIAGIAGCLYILAGHPAVLAFKENLIKKLLSFRKPLRVLLIIVIMLPLLTGGFGLYGMKKGSADGRLLIWQVTSELIKQSPVTGHGTGAFKALYMNEQANWFASGKGTEAQAMVAGSPDAPFNEPLKLWLEKGLIAIILAGGILYLIFVAKSKTSNLFRFIDHCIAPKPKTSNPKLYRILKGALLSILVFSLFSYPFDISSFILQLVILVALLTGSTSSLFKISGKKVLFLTLPVAIAIISATIHFIPQRQTHFQAMKTWQGADRFYSFGSYDIAAEAYEEAFFVLKANGLFLQMYGKALHMDEQHHKSNEILSMAQLCHCSQIIQNTVGDNQKALGNYPAAETAYINSSQMIPSSLLPKYLLAKLYTESGQQNKAKQTAEEILISQVKVESSATREIMNEMKEIVSQR